MGVSKQRRCAEGFPDKTTLPKKLCPRLTHVEQRQPSSELPPFLWLVDTVAAHELSYLLSIMRVSAVTCDKIGHRFARFALNANPATRTVRSVAFRADRNPVGTFHATPKAPTAVRTNCESCVDRRVTARAFDEHRRHDKFGHLTASFCDTASHRSQQASQRQTVCQKETTLPKRRCPRCCEPKRDNGANEPANQTML